MGSLRIDEFVDYLLKLEPKFATKMKGASTSEIEALEGLADVVFCSSYRQFLKHFGKTDVGALNPFFYDYSFSINDAAEYYQQLREAKVVSPKSLVFLLHGRHEFDWYLQQPADKDGDPQIVQADLYGQEQPPRIRVLFESFEKTLFTEAFIELRLSRFKHQQSACARPETAPPDALMKKCRDIAFRLGFACIPQSVGIHTAYDRGDAALLTGRTFPIDPFCCWVGTDNERETKRIAEIFSDALDGYIEKTRKIQI